MTFEETALDVALRFERAGIEYMLTGALAVNYHGTPRSTHDIDIVAVIGPSDVARVRAVFGPDYDVAEESVRVALREGSAFNAIHEQTGLKVDVWMLKGDRYSREAFARRKQYPYGDRLITIATPEDTIIIKLEWYRLSGIDKHYFDARGIAAVQKGELDTAYIARWCEAKSLSDLWRRVQAETDF